MKPSGPQNTMRTFIAIPIPENIRLFLGRIQGEMKETRVNASWIQTSSLHLTLRYIGDTSEKDVKDILEAMKATAVVCGPFTLFVQGVGVFPSFKKARVIWSGVMGQVDLLETLQTTLEKNIGKTRINADHKRFFPHVTLGRFRKTMDCKKMVNLIQSIGQYGSEPCLINSMVLFKSNLKPGGAVHTPLFEVEFAGNPPGQINPPMIKKLLKTEKTPGD